VLVRYRYLDRQAGALNRQQTKSIEGSSKAFSNLRIITASVSCSLLFLDLLNAYSTLSSVKKM
jgi:hypothetical protein